MKKVKISTIILVIILITMIAFGGVYTFKNNNIKDIVKKYAYSMDLNGSRNVTLKIDQNTKTTIKDKDGNIVNDTEELTEEQMKEKGYIKEEKPVNETEKLSVENYKKTKKILEKRLKKLGVDNYIIRLNEENGEMVIELPENRKTDDVIGNLSSIGKFELSDSKTNEILMNNEDIKRVNVMYGNGQTNQAGQNSGTTVYLNIEFDKEGTKKLEEISGKYIKVEKPEEENRPEEENKPEEENNQEVEENKVTLKLDDEEIMTTSFEEVMKTGVLQLSVGQPATDQKTLQENVERASNVAVALDNGVLPVQYSIDGYNFVKTDMTQEKLNIINYIFIAMTLIAAIVLIIKYKTNGALGAILYIGLGAILSLIIRYANVMVSIEGIFGIVIIMILNYILTNKILEKVSKDNISNEELKEVYEKFFIKIIPICIVVVTLCFANWASISSFGMIMFWGILLIAIYNVAVTNTLLKIKAEK